MTRTEPARYAKQRDITFLCQECGGDLEPKPVAGQFQCRFECQRCRLVWFYGGRGWERVESSR
jgi:hypothetical protein